MGNLYLNKNVKFKCQDGNRVWFKAQNKDSKIKVNINGAEALVDNCSLSLIGAPHPGQCNLFFDPATEQPSPCIAISIPGMGWNNSTNVSVSGKRLLGSSCSIKCLRQGSIKPFEPTYRPVNVDDNVSDTAISNTKAGISEDSTADTEGENDKQKCEQGKNSEEKAAERVPYALCDYENCSNAAECEYLKASFEIKEIDGSKNVGMLKENMENGNPDFYKEECRVITSTLFDGKTYTVAHHHIIPAKECFRQYPEIVMLANYYNYDINNALNGICLPTMKKGYGGQERDQKLEIAFEAMRKLGKQWHMGPHTNSKRASEIEKISKEIDDCFINSKPIKDYKSSVNEYLDQFRNKLEAESKCRKKHFDIESKDFCDAMNHICRKIENKLRKFESDPQKSHSFFVSNMALYYAYYDVLKPYQNDLF